MEADFTVNGCVVEFVRGDITDQKTDAIVNAANRELAPGGGVSGAIHRAAGPMLWDEAKKLGGCETGKAKITYGYNLPARYVIHTVGPVYSGSPDDARLLYSCYKESLHLALTHEAKSVAFPVISTGIFGYPLNEAAEISISAVADFLKEREGLNLVRFVLFGERDLDAYTLAMRNAAAK